MTEKEAEQVAKFARIQSPSSINTYRQCPRKYYYSYIKKLKSLPSIHLTRGKVVHSTLEEFFTINIDNLTKDDYDYTFKVVLNEIFKKHWQKSYRELSSLQLKPEELKHYHDESVMMINQFHKNFVEKIKVFLEKETLQQAFKHLAPETEKYYISKDHGVRGFIDAIHKIEGKVILMDYKTSKRDVISEDYKLQLAIYALLYEQTHDTLPSKVGINFLKFNEQTLTVDKELLEFAKKEVELIHKSTTSIDIKDYSKQITPLCKWRTGQCDHYNVCIKE
ncbi:MAG: PD-(D/E)XK nuclease family protein [Candidatus Woesearchaeota archaeon]|jgi:ATP-dependent exoDNAse (exonuclease V) beta subunit|nr:PD-(D/E)XK nuclease family protein [Candidatus Woesearchaeota archaeon]